MEDWTKDGEDYWWTATDQESIRAKCEERGMSGLDLDTTLDEYLAGRKNSSTVRIARIMAVTR